MPTQIRKFFPTILKLLIIFVVAAGFAALWFVNTLPDRADAQQTIVIGPTRFAPDSEAALRVVVQEVGSGRPVANAAVKVSLQPEAGGRATPLFEGITDDSGSLPVSFRVPDDAETEQQLVVETKSDSGSDRLELVGEFAARRNRLLRYIGHAVHRVRQPYSVPVHSRRLVESVAGGDPDRLALAHPDLRARYHSVIGPDICVRPLPADQRGRSPASRQRELAPAGDASK